MIILFLESLYQKDYAKANYLCKTVARELF